MATLNIYIGTDPDATYDVNPPAVHRGDSVVFHLQGRTDEVKVVIDDGDDSPFTSNNLLLDGGSAPTAQMGKTVTSTATLKRYSFTAVPQSQPPIEEPEPPGTVKGGFDVSTDNPER